EATLQVVKTLAELLAGGDLDRVLDRGRRIDVVEATWTGLELLVDVLRVDLPLDVEGVGARHGRHEVALVRAGRAKACGEGEWERREARGRQRDREGLLETLHALARSRVRDAQVEAVHEARKCRLVQPTDFEFVWPHRATLVRRRGAGECDEAHHDDQRRRNERDETRHTTLHGLSCPTLTGPLVGGGSGSRRSQDERRAPLRLRDPCRRERGAGDGEREDDDRDHTHHYSEDTFAQALQTPTIAECARSAWKPCSSRSRRARGSRSPIGTSCSAPQLRQTRWPWRCASARCQRVTRSSKCVCVTYPSSSRASRFRYTVEGSICG